MKAEIITLTPEKAKELLKRNPANRQMKKMARVYAAQMKNGQWKENGEAIIIDTNGFMKDGQHRCAAVIEADFSYDCPLVTGVEPDVMDTIDTGANRSLGDVLHLNGFNMANDIAAIVKGIMAYKRGLVRSNGGSARESINNHISNTAALDYAMKRKAKLYEFAKIASKLYSSQTSIKLLSKRDIGVLLFIISGESYDYTTQHVDFIKMICGIKLEDSSATKLVYKKLLHAKSNKLTMSQFYKFAIIIKVWNVYAKGDYALSRLPHIKEGSSLDKVEKLETQD